MQLSQLHQPSFVRGRSRTITSRANYIGQRNMSYRSFFRPLLAIGLALVVAKAEFAFGEASGPDYFKVNGVASNDVLNIRKGPSASADKIGEIPADGTGIRNLGCEGGLTFGEWQRATQAERAAAARKRWCRISYRDVEGWVADRFLAEGSQTRDSGENERAANPAYWGVSGKTDVLNLRSDPNGDSKVLMELLPGTVVRNLGCKEFAGQVWCQVEQLNGDQLQGWLSANYLEKPDASLRVGQGAFDATGKIPCAQFSGQPMNQCNFGVARDGGGTATVSITRPDGLKRAVFFDKGVAIGADTSEADGYHDLSAEKESDLNFIRVGPERYEIPDAVIFGG